MRYNYTLEELSKEETYTQDTELATLARKAAGTEWQKMPSGTMPFGDFKREVLAGKHPQIVKDLLDEKKREQDAEMEIHNMLVEAYKKVVAPNGIEMTLTGNEILIVTSRWDGNDLGKRLSGRGAYWDEGTRRWRLPLENVESLPRIFKNWVKSQAEKQESNQAEATRQEAQRAEARRQREAIWAEARRQREAQRVSQKTIQAKAVSERVRVKVGEYKIGDTINGKPITGFGKQWSESSLPHGQLYQECNYGQCQNEPVCVYCFKCSKHCTCDRINYQYAYFA